MRQDFSETLRLALQFAQANARKLNQDFVGTEHIFLGLLDCESSEAMDALQQAGIDRRALRQALSEQLPRGDGPAVVLGELPFSPRAQRLVQASMVKAREDGRQSVSTLDVFNLIYQQPGSISREVLAALPHNAAALQSALAEPCPHSEA